jgi:hypothetical protein
MTALRQHPDAVDAPVQRRALVHEPVVVDRLVRGVGAADADVRHAWHDQGPVIGGGRAVGRSSTSASAH